MSSGAPDRLLMGFDSPLMPDTLVEPAKRAVAEYEHFSARDHALISAENALRLVPRLVDAAVS